MFWILLVLVHLANIQSKHTRCWEGEEVLDAYTDHENAYLDLTFRSGLHENLELVMDHSLV